ncbi:MAG: hypothetical protein ACYTFY_20915 [Planctomycetota bacterium]|jgi:hypothetical protein
MNNMMDNNRLTLFGLIYMCPHNKNNKDCPYAKLRELPLKEREETINNMDTFEIIKLLNHHQVCSSNDDF